MSAIDRVKAHFVSLGARHISVPEWDGLEIHFTPVTPVERNKIYSSKTDSDADVLVRILIEKAKDAEGKPLFTVGDKHALLVASDVSVLIRVCAELMGSGAPKVQEIKN